ncbi:hypothetical protein MMC10_006253 [Thelotrema lepadinum]|nr:hypothetical protein [Thelotrema lepadinum]
MADSKSISLQYDLGVSSTALSNKLLELIGAASEDNVQPQSVLALRALGSLLHPDPNLIGKAVNALDGVQNIKIEHMKLTIGLNSGGTAAFLRQSTPGIAGFLLICAFKLAAYSDHEIGEILYHMALESGTLTTWPTSSQQFTQVVDVLTEYTSSMLPIDRLYNVSAAIVSTSEFDRRSVMDKMATTALAKVMSATFTCLLDDDVSQVELEGIDSASWLVTVFTWLMPDQTVAVHGDEIIWGGFPRRLVIRLRDVPATRTPAEALQQGPPSADNMNRGLWVLRKWHKETSVKDLIITDSSFKPSSFSMSYPRKSCKHVLQSRYGLTLSQIGIIGQIAGALHCLFIEKLNLSFQMLGDSFISRPLLDICTNWFSREYASIMLQYGWDLAELREQSKTYDTLLEQKVTIDDILELGKQKDFFKKCVRQWPKENFPIVYNGLTHAIIGMIEDSLLFASLNVKPDSPLPIFMKDAELLHNQKHDFLKLGLTTGLTFRSFRRKIFENIYPHHDGINGNALIVAGNGLVVWPSIINELSLKKSMALALNVMPGYIRRGRERFSMVIEENVVKLSVLGSGFAALGFATPFEQETFVGLFPKSQMLQTEFQVQSNSRGSLLYIDHKIAFRGPSESHHETTKFARKSPQTGSSTQSFSWIRALEGISSAVHLTADHSMTLRGEEALARRIWKEEMDDPTDLPEWVSVDACRPPMVPLGKYVAQTCGDVMLSLYQLSQPSEFFVLCHNGSLIKGISLATQESGTWCVLT